MFYRSRVGKDDKGCKEAMTIREQYPPRISACPQCNVVGEHIPSTLALHAGERHMRLWLLCGHYANDPDRVTPNEIIEYLKAGKEFVKPPTVLHLEFRCGACDQPLEADVRADDAETLQQCRCGHWTDVSDKIADAREAL